MVLPAFVAGGTSLVWTWFATAWTYAILLVPILLLPAALGRRDDPVLRAATYVGATSVRAVADRVPALGVRRPRRWPTATSPATPPPRPRSRRPGPPSTSSAVPCSVSTWASCWPSAGRSRVSVIILRSRVLPRWVGVAGLVVSVLYLLNQGDILATAVPGFPVWDLAGFSAAPTWGLWVAALGVTLLLRPSAAGRPDADRARTARRRAGTPASAGPVRRQELTAMNGSPHPTLPPAQAPG